VAGLLLELSGHLLAIQEMLSRPEVRSLAAYRERHRGCSEAYTWVENRAGSKYWYWYLKCPGRRPTSVYLGAGPEAHRALMEAAEAVARVQRELADLDLGELASKLAEAARRLEKLEATAPAETAQHTASTPRKQRKSRKGAPTEQTSTARQEPQHPPHAQPEAPRPPLGNPTPSPDTAPRTTTQPPPSTHSLGSAC
jgi:hypothetical protein